MPRPHLQFPLSTLLWLTFAAACFFGGCSEARRPQPADVVSAWANSGIFLPSKDDVEFIRDRLPESLTALRMGVESKNEHVRRCSAHVAERLGAGAAPLVAILIHRLSSETIPNIRRYLASAVAAIGQVDTEGIRELRENFASEPDEQVKTDIAGALVRLNSAREEPMAWEWLLQSLKAFPPDPPPAETEARHMFWERRWSAAKHVRAIRGNDDVLLPLLRALLENPNTPAWVIEQQVAEATAEIENRVLRTAE